MFDEKKVAGLPNKSLRRWHSLTGTSVSFPELVDDDLWRSHGIQKELQAKPNNLHERHL